jgi:hypothetical protein
VWPLEDSLAKASIKEILDRMLDFDGSKIQPRPAIPSSGLSSTTACKYCTMDWEGIVVTARCNTSKYFDGLCMDCMATTKNMRLSDRMATHKMMRLTLDDDYDYWHHNERRHDYSAGCRLKHGEPTWYFSFMGRRERLGQFDQPADLLENSDDMVS